MSSRMEETLLVALTSLVNLAETDTADSDCKFTGFTRCVVPLLPSASFFLLVIISINRIFFTVLYQSLFTLAGSKQTIINYKVETEQSEITIYY